MTDKVAIVYWCDGAGHAARSIPVAQEFESRGIEVAIGGGGQGKPFVDMNGFEQPEFTKVAVKGSTPLAFARHTLLDLVPSSVRRFREINQWLKDEAPDMLITDDIFAGLAATIQGVEFYRIDHLTPELFGPVWGTPLKLYNEISLLSGEQIIVSSLWEDDPDPAGITRVGPLAQEGNNDEEVDPAEEVEAYDVLLNPGTHGENFTDIRARLEANGYDVRTVGDDDWETKPAMTPYTAAANVVVCTGFSSIADTVVAGTPCIIYPFLPFQKALADRADTKDIKGISKATSVDAVVDTVEYYCHSEEKPAYENGATAFVDAVLES